VKAAILSSCIIAITVEYINTEGVKRSNSG
jgi:hypothetical protein